MILNTEQLVYIVRKTSLTLEDIGKFSPRQAIDFFKELLQQEQEDKYELYTILNTLLSVIHNAPISKPRIMKPNDFYQIKRHKRQEIQKDLLTSLCEKKGIKLPKS